MNAATRITGNNSTVAIANRPSRRSAFAEASRPLGFRGGLSNLTEYVGDDPTNATDPTGLAENWISQQITYKTGDNKEKTGILKVNTNKKKGTVIGFTFTSSDGKDIDAEVNFLQFSKRSVYKSGTEVTFKKGDNPNGNAAFEDGRGYLHFFGEKYHVDTQSKDKNKPYYVVEDKFRTPSKVQIADVPADLAPPAAKYDETKLHVVTYLVINNKVYYRATWNTYEKLVEGKWEAGYIENVKGETVDKVTDDFAKETSLFGGYIYDGNDYKETKSYDNPILNAK